MSKRIGYFALILDTDIRHHVTMEPREDGQVEVTTFTSDGPRYSPHMTTVVMGRAQARAAWAAFRRGGYRPALAHRDGTKAEREADAAKRAARAA